MIWKIRGNVVIHGEVAKPDSYPYADNMTLEDLIIQAGGLREAASAGPCRCIPYELRILAVQ